MGKAGKNKELIFGLFRALNGAEGKGDIATLSAIDPKLVKFITFLETLFPRYRLLIDEMTTEGQRIIVRARFVGLPEGNWESVGLPDNAVEIPFVAGYFLENGKIIDHWLISDQLAAMEQLGVGKPR